MVKTIIIHHLPDMNDLPAAERWFYRYHVPEVLRNQPEFMNKVVPAFMHPQSVVSSDWHRVTEPRFYV